MKYAKSTNRLAPALGVAWGLVILMVVAATLGAAPRSSAAQLGAPPAPLGPCAPGDTQTMIWPSLAAVSPSTAGAGTIVRVTGSGGYILCGNGTYDESARTFSLTIDGRALAPIQCYVNRCQVDTRLPADLEPGTYAIVAEGGSQLTLTVGQRATGAFNLYLPQIGGRHMAPVGTPGPGTPTVTPTIRPPFCPPNDPYEIFWPALTLANPDHTYAGHTVRVMGGGGYIRCSDGAYDESSRYFTLTLADQPLAPINCYANHCQVDITVPGDLAPGIYQLVAQGGSSLTLTILGAPCPVPAQLLTATPSRVPGSATPPPCPTLPPCAAMTYAGQTVMMSACPTPPTRTPTYTPTPCRTPAGAALLTPTPSRGTPTPTPTGGTPPPPTWTPTPADPCQLTPTHTPTWTPTVTNTPTPCRAPAGAALLTPTPTPTGGTPPPPTWTPTPADPCQPTPTRSTPTWTPTPVFSCPTPGPGVTATPCPTWTPTPTPTAAWSCPTPWPGVTATPCPTWTPTPTPGGTPPQRVLRNTGIPCSPNAPANYDDTPPEYTTDCVISAGHSAAAELHYFADSAEVTRVFDIVRGSAPTETFHGQTAFYRQDPAGPAPHGTSQVFAWKGAHWLIILTTYDDTSNLAPIRSFAETTYGSAVANNLEAYAP